MCVISEWMCVDVWRVALSSSIAHIFVGRYLVDQLFGSSSMDPQAVKDLINNCTKALRTV